MSLFGNLFKRSKPKQPDTPAYVKPTPSAPARPSPFTQEQMKIRMERAEADARRNGDVRGLRRVQQIKRTWGV